MNNIIEKDLTEGSNTGEVGFAKKFKKFRSAYILFSLDYRQELKLRYPSYGNPELTKMIAKEWKNLDIMRKQEYYLKEKAEKDNFERKKKEDHIVYKYNKNDKMKKPIRFRTPYMFYIMDHKLFLNNKDKYKNIELIKRLSEKWKTMNEEEKAPYVEKSILDKKRYQMDWEKYITSYFKVKKKNVKKKEKTEKMILDLLKLCNNNENFHQHLQSVWSKFHNNGEFNEVYNFDGKYKNQILLKRLIFKIEKVPKSIKDEIKFERDVEDNYFTKYVKEEEEDDTEEELFEIDNMMDMYVKTGPNANNVQNTESEPRTEIDMFLQIKRNATNEY
jgi:hypothetical protein